MRFLQFVPFIASLAAAQGTRAGYFYTEDGATYEDVKGGCTTLVAGHPHWYILAVEKGYECILYPNDACQGEDIISHSPGQHDVFDVKFNSLDCIYVGEDEDDL